MGGMPGFWPVATTGLRLFLPREAASADVRGGALPTLYARPGSTP